MRSAYASFVWRRRARVETMTLKPGMVRVGREFFGAGEAAASVAHAARGVSVALSEGRQLGSAIKLRSRLCPKRDSTAPGPCVEDVADVPRRGPYRPLGGALEENVRLRRARMDIAGGASRLVLLQAGGVLFSQICESAGCPYTSKALGSLSTARFRRATIDLRWGDPNPQVEISIDGSSTGVVPFPLQGAGSVRVIVGCEFGAACPDPVAIRVDDVVVDTLP